MLPLLVAAASFLFLLLACTPIALFRSSVFAASLGLPYPRLCLCMNMPGNIRPPLCLCLRSYLSALCFWLFCLAVCLRVSACSASAVSLLCLLLLPFLSSFFRVAYSCCFFSSVPEYACITMPLYCSLHLSRAREGTHRSRICLPFSVCSRAYLQTVTHLFLCPP